MVPVMAGGLLIAAPDRERVGILSSVLHRRLMLPLPALLLAGFGAVATLTPQQAAWYRAQLGLTGSAYAAPMAASAGVTPDPVAEAVVQWKRLNQSDGLLFQEYANFLVAHPGWPGTARMRARAETAVQPDLTPPDAVIAFFSRFAPLSGTASLRYAEALYARGRPAEAAVAARRAWTLGGLSTTDEGRLTARFWAQITPQDQDERMERLLWTRAVVAAQRQLGYVTPARRPLYAARLAYQLRSPDAPAQAATLGIAAGGDAGYVADRANWLRATMQEATARFELAQPHRLDAPPYDPERYMELLLTFARSTAADRNWAQAYGIASQVAALYPAGTDLRALPYGQRDDYTSLAWLAGQTAYGQLRRYADATAMFRAYGDAARSPVSRAKGYYWAGRAAQAAGDAAGAQGYFENAAAFPDQFYGALALERLNRPEPAPATADATIVSPIDRAAFDADELVRAARILGQLGDWTDQTQFLRAIAAASETSDSTHLLAAQLAREIGRPDLGVMAARAAKPESRSDYVASGFPTLAVPADLANSFSFIHGIMRQESQFDRNAVSGAGARGMMQLMPATAREEAGRQGLPYDYMRLTSDPAYNMRLGTGYFGRMMDQWQGNYVLAIASYNAGAGNVRRWVAQNGDPRSGGIDPVEWIEAIPFSETRGYVQNVLANTLVYDTIDPARRGAVITNRLSYYLGKRPPG